MIRLAAWRGLSTWLIGLFFLAQIGGVVHLLGEHTAHVTESQMAGNQVAGRQLPASHASLIGHASHHHHHEGDADGAIQHHELQDLNGAPLRLVGTSALTVVSAALAPDVPNLLAGRNPVLPERPPKPFLSV